MVKNGNKLVFDQDSSGKDTSYIKNKRTNEKIWLRPESGVYVLDLMVAPPANEQYESSSPFPQAEEESPDGRMFIGKWEHNECETHNQRFRSQKLPEMNAWASTKVWTSGQ